MKPNKIKKPRIGQRVKWVKDGKFYKVIGSRNASQILKTMNNSDAYVFGHEKKSVYGPKWMEIFFQIDILKKGVLVVLETNDVEEVKDTD